MITDTDESVTIRSLTCIYKLKKIHFHFMSSMKFVYLKIYKLYLFENSSIAIVTHVNEH